MAEIDSTADPMKVKGCVYLARNTLDGNKLYIGKTIEGLRERRKSHISNAKSDRRCCRYFHAAIRKYGASAFEWTVLFSGDNEDELNAKEMEFIKLLDTKVPRGYNLTDGGEGISGMRHSEESKEKISRSRKGIGKGKSLDPEHCAAISAGRKGKKFGPLSEATKAKLRAANTGRKHTAESRAKMSRWQIGRKMPPLTKEQRQRRSDQVRAQWAARRKQQHATMPLLIDNT